MVTKWLLSILFSILQRFIFCFWVILLRWQRRLVVRASISYRSKQNKWICRHFWYVLVCQGATRRFVDTLRDRIGFFCVWGGHWESTLFHCSWHVSLRWENEGLHGHTHWVRNLLDCTSDLSQLGFVVIHYSLGWRLFCSLNDTKVRMRTFLKWPLEIPIIFRPWIAVVIGRIPFILRIVSSTLLI